MPEDAGGGLLEIRLLEHQWPTVVVLGLLAAGLCWLAVQRDDRRLLHGGLGLAAISLGIGLLGAMVETDRESAVAATRAFVADAEAGRIDAMLDTLHPESTLHAGRVESPGFPRGDLEAALERLRRDHRIEENTITDLQVGTDPQGVIWVELACLTRTASSYGLVPSRWVFEWSGPPDADSWRIRSLTALSVAGRRPDGRNVIR